ncbi:MAG TPA: YceI family protein [Tepidisphaeraceae bacterium]|jgi:polyisoprenoid-binding protein YceI
MTDRYTLIPDRSRFAVQAFAGGMLSGFAHNPVFAVRSYTGDIRFDSDGLNLWCQIAVQADSLQITGSPKDSDREEITRAMFEEVLEIKRFPQILFASTASTVTKIADNWFRAQVKGDMQIHGMTKPQSIDFQVRVSDEGLRLSGEFPLSLTTYKMKRVSALGGMIQLKDELKFSFDLVAQKQASSK